jgi:hypothetical protein
MRKTNLSESLYQWEPANPQLPSHVKGVPRGEGFSAVKIFIFLFNTLKGLIGLLIAQLIHLFPFLYKQKQKGKLVFTGTADFGLISILSGFNDWEKIDDFNEFFKPWTFLKKPSIAKQKWQSDTQFTYERLNGINPAFIKKCRQSDIYPVGKFRVTDEILKPVWGSDITLASALASDRLYVLDYKIFDNILNPQLEDQLGRYAFAPLCLLYVNDEKQLVPIAIQLQQKTVDDNAFNRIFTPGDDSEVWLTAKTVIGSADISYQGIVSHLLHTHLIAETFAIATFRKLSPEHIISQILKPHFFNTLAINNMARGVFLPRKGLFDIIGALGYTGSHELLIRGYSGKGSEYQGEPWLFYKQSLPYDLTERNVYDLPGYYYREDALLIWDAIKDYVSDVLKLQYKVVDDIINDKELQAWKNELIDPNYGNIQGLLSPDKFDQLTESFNSLDDLIEIVTNIIFTVTVRHSAVNFGQYEHAAWIPNLPFAIYQSFSDFLENDNKEKIDLVKKLPSRWQSILQIVLMSTLSLAPPYTSESLLTLKNPFSHTPAKLAFETFQKHLQEIEEKISVRNLSRSQPYIYLLPSKIAQSIAI